MENKVELEKEKRKDGVDLGIEGHGGGKELSEICDGIETPWC